MRTRQVIFAVALGLAATACSSGSAFPDALPPTTTTTTEAPAVGVEIVRISNGSFQPSNITLNLDEVSIIKFMNDDDGSEYSLTSRDDLFEDVEFNGGDEFEFDFAGLEEKIYRFSALAGFNRLPLSIDTRPDL